ncbi:MAG TPA: tetratricopeptide repeat protein [Verrucomicrobiae bacterium]|nr:tetratricopeptide repeat protein [Verrucomicrobiae bacterium]
MIIFRQWLLILFALVLGGEQTFAASAKEQRAFSSALVAFQDGVYSRAENELDQFVKKFPESTNAPMAVLLQAQAQFKQGKFTNAVATLTLNQPKAGSLADQYDYWIGESRFADGDLVNAAESFNSVVTGYPASRLRLSSVVEAASVYMKLGEWWRVDQLLGQTNGVFAGAAQLDPANELISRGQLILAQAKFEQGNYDGAADVLAQLNSQTLKPDFDWQRAYLLCRIKMATQNWNAALAAATNLQQIARLEKKDDLRAQAVAMRADIYEKMNQPGDAMAAYRENLADGIPAQRQEQAILKIADIAAAQNKFTEAENSLENFLTNFPDSPENDIASLTIGELLLKNFAAQRSQTNLLAEAQSQFDQFISTFTNSAWLGNAYLDRGWCFWLEGNIAESLLDFRAAAQKLSPSPELAVARLKIGDAQFAQGDFSGARENYRSALTLTNFSFVKETLADRALYQELRASLELRDQRGAAEALTKLLRRYPPSNLLHNAELLYGEGLADLGKPAQARVTFETFEQQFPDSPLQPQVELAIAHTYELQGDWANAIAKYQNWLGEFPTNDLNSRVSYSLALSYFYGGDETNALSHFENFVIQFPASEYAPLAQWWIADYFFRQDEYIGAETNYERVYQRWPSSDLVYPAQIMAGRAAAARGGNSDAINYFNNVIADTNCPLDKANEARFALGTTLMRTDSSDTNNPLANFMAATNVFAQIVQLSPTNELAALALGEIGKCDFQISDYVSATNAYAQVIALPAAPSTARCQAKVGIGLALEKMAALSPDDRTSLLELALENYLDVFYSDSGFYRDGEIPDDFWVKTAGLQALPLLKMSGAAETGKFIDRMEQLLPQLKNALETERQKFLQKKHNGV